MISENGRGNIMEYIENGVSMYYEDMPDQLKWMVSKFREAKDRRLSIVIEPNNRKLVSVTFNIDKMESCVDFDYVEHPEIAELVEKLEQIALDKMDKLNWARSPYLNSMQHDLDLASLPDDVRKECERK